MRGLGRTWAAQGLSLTWASLHGLCDFDHRLPYRRSPRLFCASAQDGGV